MGDNGMESWIPVTDPDSIPNYYSNSSLKVGDSDIITNDSLPFLEQGEDDLLLAIGPDEPVEVIVSRVVYALLISVSLVMNLLLIIAVLRTKFHVPTIYLLFTAMIIPDIIFYTKVILELINWAEVSPSWTKDDMSCGFWQFLSHLYPLFYSYLLVAAVFQSFITLFLDTRGVYEKGSRKLMPLLLLGLMSLLVMISAPSGFYSKSVTLKEEGTNCQLKVPPIIGDDITDQLEEQARVAYRLAYELVLPYFLPLLLLAFPYLSLLVGLMRGLEATDHADYTTKISSVVTLWVLTIFLMLQVPTLIKNVFSIFSVWHRLTSLFDAVDDPRIPMFQTYIQMTSYMLTILWSIIRPSLCFKYSKKLRKALGP